MSDTSSHDGASDAKHPNASPIRIEVQYVKDLSFENPQAPRSLQQNSKQPGIDIQVDVKATKLGDNVYEVVLTSTVKGSIEGDPLFLIELSYAGVFTLAGVPDEHLQPLLLIECPRLLFPFARNIIADVTRDGGYPPLLVQPLDFSDIYRRSLQDRSAGEATPSPSPD